jgi:anti-sigma regulatory factor (Ser/Thr protein kinase)
VTGATTFSANIDPAAGGLGLVPIRDDLRRWLVGVGVADPELHEILIAAGEACTNAVEHSGAVAENAEPAAWIRATCTGDQVRIVVNDRGRWTEPVATTPSGRRGRGRLMMAALVDRMTIHTDADGTTVELVKDRT